MNTVTFKGKKVALKGELPAIGERVPPAQLVDGDLNEVTLDKWKGRRRLLSLFPSIDTQVCSRALRTFCERLTGEEELILLNISRDLPFAQRRFCVAHELEQAVTLSAFRSPIGSAWGVEIAEGPLQGLLARSLFLLDGEGRLLYRQLVSEITDEPDYDAALKAASTSIS